MTEVGEDGKPGAGPGPRGVAPLPAVIGSPPAPGSTYRDVSRAENLRCSAAWPLPLRGCPTKPGQQGIRIEFGNAAPTDDSRPGQTAPTFYGSCSGSTRCSLSPARLEALCCDSNAALASVS